MKKNRIILTLSAVVMMLLTATNVQAQQKNRLKKPQQTITQKNVQQKTLPAKIAAYSGTNTTSTKGWCVGKDKIYFVEVENKNNAVKSIDCNTGEVTTIIPGIAGIYEGARPVIESVTECAGKLFFVLKKGGVYQWDGKSVETSKQIPDSYDIMASTDRYLLYSVNSDNRTSFVLMDLVDTKILNILPYDSRMDGKRIFIASDGSLSFFASVFPIRNDKGETIDQLVSGFGLERIKNKDDKKHAFFNLYDLPYVSMSKDERGHHLDFGDTFQLGDSVYIAVSRCIYRLDLLAEHPTWEEFLRVPPTLPGRFSHFRINRKGDLLTYFDQYSNSDTQLWRHGLYDKPENLGRALKTNFKDWGWDSINLYSTSLRIDCNDNFLLFNNSIEIWNPDGIVGYNQSKGKIYKISK